MMILKEHNISVRLPQEWAIDTGIVFVQNDKDVYKLNVRVFDGDTEINYSQVSSATITFLKADGTVVQGEMQKTSNMLAYVLGTNEIAAPGKLIATIQLLGANERLTTARFLFRVEKDLITEDAVKSTSEFPILQRLVKDVEDTLPLLPEIEETIEKFPQIQEFFNTAQVAENQRISNEITRQSQESVRQAKIIEIEERFQRLTSQQQHDAEVIDARDGEISLRARLDRDRAEFESHKADSAPHPEANFATKNYVQSNTMFIFPQSSHISDANLNLTDGIYPVGSTLKNGPYAETIGDNQGMLIVMRWQFNLNFRIQIHVSIYNGSIYVRRRNSLGEWTPWRRVIDSSVLMSGNGSPEGVVTAPVGTLYRRTDGGASSTLYVKESGTGNTGWKAVQTI